MNEGKKIGNMEMKVNKAKNKKIKWVHEMKRWKWMEMKRDEKMRSVGSKIEKNEEGENRWEDVLGLEMIRCSRWECIKKITSFDGGMSKDVL